ncbi:MAG: polyphosphate kinase 1 [Treponema sp.]|jgi:polyphosphate kinase|nr:polyphosphate kinase 1 [Treponema sp.]
MNEQGSGEAVRYLDRDLSWIDFNERVLEEGLRRDLPPLERFRFLAIVSSNFDEFFMVRVAAMKRAALAAAEHSPSAGTAQSSGADLSRDGPGRLAMVSEKVRSIVRRQYECLENEVFPDLAGGGLELVRRDGWTDFQKRYLESFFLGEIFPILTPLRIDETLPAIDSLSLNCAFLIGDEAGKEYAAMVQIPQSIDRIIIFPAEDGGHRARERVSWALLEDAVLSWGHYFFSGLSVRESMVFKVNRDADFSVDEKRDEDFIEAMEEVLEDRERSTAVRMVYSPGSVRLKREIAERLALEEDDLYEVPGPINLGALLELVNVRGFDSLKEKPWKIYPSGNFSGDESIWDRIKAGDVMLHLPYQSFDPVVRFFQEASSDPQVISIKTALYRTSGNSPVVRALEQAGLAGKRVTAMVELKARFDEERNISWARGLERAGVIVVYGLAGLKVHAKVTLVIRRENDRLVRYVHVATGNYNDKTARLYEDIGIFTCRDEIAYDAGLLFNMITGYSFVQPMRKLSIAPTGLKRRLLELIGREAKRASQGYPGKIMAKINSLADTDIIDALYGASQAGVKIFLSVRGVCTLVPGVPGLSENIQVSGIVDHYLEHSRICYFANGGAEEIFISSADWMPRNLERRVELMFPVQEEPLRKELLEILPFYFRDNTQAYNLGPDGVWKRRGPAEDEAPFRVQKELLSRAARASGNLWSVKQEFIVRRSPPEGPSRDLP